VRAIPFGARQTGAPIFVDPEPLENCEIQPRFERAARRSRIEPLGTPPVWPSIRDESMAQVKPVNTGGRNGPMGGKGDFVLANASLPHERLDCVIKCFASVTLSQGRSGRG
jgi:hypothetical protein